MSTHIPGAIPRACDATYRGNLADKPRLVEKNERKFAAGRIGVNMAAPDVSPEERDQLTEWVDVIAFSEAMQARLLACEKGETIAVSGNVTKKFYQRRNGETAQGRTIVADYIRAAGASIAAPGSRGRTDDKPEPAPNPNAPPE